jgi:hypothetical protein
MTIYFDGRRQLFTSRPRSRSTVNCCFATVIRAPINSRFSSP